MAGLAYATAPAHRKFPPSGGSRHVLAEPTRALDSAVVARSAAHRRSSVSYFVRADIDGHSRLTPSAERLRLPAGISI
jgi:hypothetical protein